MMGYKLMAVVGMAITAAVSVGITHYIHKLTDSHFIDDMDEPPTEYGALPTEYVKYTSLTGYEKMCEFKYDHALYKSADDELAQCCYNDCSLNDETSNDNNCKQNCLKQLCEKFYHAEYENLYPAKYEDETGYGYREDERYLYESYVKSCIRKGILPPSIKLILHHIKDPNFLSKMTSEGGDVNVRDSTGRTPLMYADNDIENVKLLIAAGADVNAKDNEGRTALMFAINGSVFGQLEAVKALIAAGADVNAKDDDGRTALVFAKILNDNAIIQVLKDVGAQE